MIKQNFNIGDKFSKELIVEDKHTAKFIGSGGLEVFSTPSLVALMELASKEFIDPKLENGYSTVGIEILVKHLKATPIGDKVICNGKVEEIDGKKIKFFLECFDSKGKIGEGTHYRFIVENEKFLKKIYS
ncbi:MAG: thioesterase family protein [Spirochaetes bacterium]|nr:thioesterase family protein [Spirochaetota bacterium]